MTCVSCGLKLVIPYDDNSLADIPYQGILAWIRNFGGSGFGFGSMGVEKGDRSLLIAGESASKEFGDMTSRGGADAVIIRVASGIWQRRLRDLMKRL